MGSQILVIFGQRIGVTAQLVFWKQLQTEMS